MDETHEQVDEEEDWVQGQIDVESENDWPKTKQSIDDYSRHSRSQIEGQDVKQKPSFSWKQSLF